MQNVQSSTTFSLMPRQLLFDLGLTTALRWIKPRSLVYNDPPILIGDHGKLNGYFLPRV
jgi:hypothetical protein